MPVDFDPLYTPPKRIEFLSSTILGPHLSAELGKIRKACISTFGGVNRWCLPISTFIDEELHFPRVVGHYVDPNPDHNNLRSTHCWNMTPDGGLYVDITHTQFDSNAPEIAVLSLNQSVLVPSQAVFDQLGLSTYFLPDATKQSIKVNL